MSYNNYIRTSYQQAMDQLGTYCTLHINARAYGKSRMSTGGFYACSKVPNEKPDKDTKSAMLTNARITIDDSIKDFIKKGSIKLGSRLGYHGRPQRLVELQFYNYKTQNFETFYRRGKYGAVLSTLPTLR